MTPTTSIGIVIEFKTCRITAQADEPEEQLVKLRFKQRGIWASSAHTYTGEGKECLAAHVAASTSTPCAQRPNEREGVRVGAIGGGAKANLVVVPAPSAHIV